MSDRGTGPGDGDDDEVDASDWLTSQFDPTGELPKQEPRPPVVPNRTPPNRTAPVVPGGQQGTPPPQFPPVPGTPMQERPQAASQPPVPPVPPQQPQQPVPPVQPQQPQQPVPPVPPQQPVQPQQPAVPPVAPQQPVAPAGQPPARPPVPPQQPVAPQFPLPPQQPAAQPVAPAFPVPPQPAAQVAPQQPATPAQQPGGFSWGLSPGASTPAEPVQPARPAQPAQPAQPPAAPTPPATPPAAAPPAAPPAAVPPAAVPPAAVPPATPPAAPITPAPAAGAWFEPGAPVREPAFPPATPHPAPHDPAPLDSAIAGAPSEGEPPAEALPYETTVLPDVAPDSRDAPPFWEPEPTQMMDVLELEPDARPEAAPRQPFTRSVFPEGSELLADSAPAAPTEAFGPPPGETGAVSAIDSLFGESQFREYSGIADPNENPFVRKAEPVFETADPLARPPGPPPGASKLQRILLTVLGSVLAVVALVALFFLGIRLPDVFGAAPAVVVPSASPSPTPVVAIGPVPPGEYHWDQLLGGECLDPYDSPWQEDFTVVDCAIPHAAQMVRTSQFPLPESGDLTYPGEEALQATALQRCQRSGIYAKEVSAIKDGQVEASYPVSAEDWAAGNHRYYCFVSRTTGEPITGDIALPQPTPTPTPAPTP